MNRVSIVGDSSIDNFLVLDNQDAGLRMNSGTHQKLLCLSYGCKTTIQEQYNFFGGSALNVSVSLASLGCESHLLTVVGADHEGKEILSFLNSKSVITDGVLVSGETNQSFIVIYDSERTVLSHHEKRNYSQIKIPPSEIIYFASAGEGSESLVDKIKLSMQKGAKLIFNPGSFEIESFHLFKSLLASTTILIINRDEARHVIEDTHSVNVQLEKILDFGVEIAIITDGANGAYFGTKQGHFHMNAAPVKVKDPTGAGDAFASALVAALIKGKSLEEASVWGMFSAANVIEEYGANSSYLEAAQIEKQVQGNKILKFTLI